MPYTRKWLVSPYKSLGNFLKCLANFLAKKNKQQKLKNRKERQRVKVTQLPGLGTPGRPIPRAPSAFFLPLPPSSSLEAESAANATSTPCVVYAFLNPILTPRRCLD